MSETITVILDGGPYVNKVRDALVLAAAFLQCEHHCACANLDVCAQDDCNAAIRLLENGYHRALAANAAQKDSRLEQTVSPAGSKPTSKEDMARDTHKPLTRRDFG